MTPQRVWEAPLRGGGKTTTRQSLAVGCYPVGHYQSGCKPWGAVMGRHELTKVSMNQPICSPACLQECLEDAAPQVQALGLQCIELLCEADCLDFYQAWRVVQENFPTLPRHPATAAAWVSMCLGVNLWIH